MGEKIATRNAYGETLRDLGHKYPELVVLDADLSGSTMSKFFAKEFPDRFFNMGIAEANMASVAAGLATCGKKPFINSFAMFSTGRAWEQVRNSIAYPHLNVKVVGSHGGLSVGEDGATHQCIEDLSIMRSIPGMLVINPCDANEMKQAVEELIKYDGPAYLRLGRLAVENVTDSINNYSFKIGKGTYLKKGKKVTIIATGLMVQESLKAYDILKEKGVEISIIDMPTIKPIDKEIIIDAAKNSDLIITSEEHNIVGGLGSAVAEVLSENYPKKLIRHGVNDEFGRSGSAKAVLDYYGLNADTLVNLVLKNI